VTDRGHGIDGATLAYDFDEEADGFGAPPLPVRETVPLDQKLCLGMLGAGLVALLLQLAGQALAGTWAGMGLSFGLIALGTSLWFWRLYAGTKPGIRHDGIWFRSSLARGAVGWTAGIVMTGLYVLIYWFPGVLGEREDGDPVGLVGTVDPLARLVTGEPASRWFLYGVLYTLAILVFGVRMFMKYRHSRYHQLRTTSVMGFQFLFAWSLPNLLARIGAPYMELNGVWPLKQDYLWPAKVADFTAAGLFGWGLLLFAVLLVLATPVLTYFFGKRWYCSWVCGCGGLAETLGDPWRQLSDKSTRAWKIERWMVHGVLAVVLLVTASLWIDHLVSGALWGTWSSPLRQWYGFAVGAVFAGVVGVGFYPLLGSRVWCRFGCPQAAILGLWQRLFSRFRITTNGSQCISCGNCSTYCEMGIDVQSYAQQGRNIVRASCVGCGVCASVCPRGVLKLENGATHADRFEGADRPADRFLKSLGLREEDPPENRTLGR
jgi:Pyruvate/2-oxoacid:ferredoxin oxidoreductase delta subunit